jgi:hypothetical protein
LAIPRRHFIAANFLADYIFNDWGRMLNKKKPPEYEVEWIDDPDVVEACIKLDEEFKSGQITSGGESYRVDMEPPHTRHRVIAFRRKV